MKKVEIWKTIKFHANEGFYSILKHSSLVMPLKIMILLTALLFTVYVL